MLAWVRDRNAETVADLATGERFTFMQDGIRDVLDSAEKLPGLVWRGRFLYNLWQDEAHPRGLWRRATVDDVRSGEWEVLLDLDALAAAEGENWVWGGADGLGPDYQRYLIRLSRGGADATVVREYDLATGFLSDGFAVPEAKTGVSWIDIDQIFLATDVGPASLTTSGYPRIAKRWRRGTPLSEAATVFEGEPDDVGVWAWHDQTPGFERDLILRRDVHSELLVLDPDRVWESSPLPGVPVLGHTAVHATNPDHTDELLLTTAGFTEPATLRYGTVRSELTRLRWEPAFFDATGRRVEQLWARSADGTRIPYFHVVGDSGAPVLLEAYGGFEVSRLPTYDGGLGRAWLERGGGYVLANIRGGGEFGPDWHRAALRENRPRAFEDLAAVAQDLVTRGITTPQRLGAMGGSNGGLLVGVMLTRYPALFGAIVGTVPLLDMLRYHLLLAGASWIAEYGDPDTDDRAFLRAYSPYQNVSNDAKYPPVLWITSTRDDRVHPGHARKMTARLRAAGHRVAYYENIEGGHGAAADNEQRAFRRALAFEFLWRHLLPV